MEKEIQSLMAKLGISRAEAIELWECDNGITTNQEQETLQAKAKDVKINHQISNRKAKERKKREVIDPEKRELIAILS